MGHITAPRFEGTVQVRHGRKLGVAEFGPPDGQAIVWFHGTPGARRQIPEEARQLADERGLRIIGIDRPGVGLSPPHQYESVSDFVPDLELVADQLGIERFSTVGLSGGGPYAMAAAARLPDRVASVGVLGGVVPTWGPTPCRGGWWGSPTGSGHLLPVVEVPAGYALHDLRPPGPAARPAGARPVRPFSPPGDREVLRRPEVKAMFLDDLIGERQPRAPVGGPRRHPVHPRLGLHGGATSRSRSAGGTATPTTSCRSPTPSTSCRGSPGATLHVRPGESHLGGLGIAEEVRLDRHCAGEALGPYARPNEPSLRPPLTAPASSPARRPASAPTWPGSWPRRGTASRWWRVARSASGRWPRS